jgi:hypothetical protein
MFSITLFDRLALTACPNIVVTMCGLDTSTALRIGARADLFSESQGPWGSLLFINQAVPESSTATHVRFTPASGQLMRHTSQMLVSIQYAVKLQSRYNR